MILVVGHRSWTARAFAEWTTERGRLLSPTLPDEATLKVLNPDVIAFPHWSEIVPPWCLERYECIGFHETPLPMGRGGSPIQNLIVRGHYDSQMTAFRMTPEVDAGPIYLQRPLWFHDGDVGELYLTCARVAFQMLDEILDRQIQPVPQVGEPTFFKRRRPEESLIPSGLEIRQVYDYIRMLDAPGYPHAHTWIGRRKVEFREATMQGDDPATERARWDAYGDETFYPNGILYARVRIT